MKTNYKIIIQVLILLSILCSTSLIHAQTVFEEVYPASVQQSGKDVVQTPDGGYLIASTTENSTGDDLDLYMVKTNSVGDIQWTKTYGGSMVDFPHFILPIGSGNYFVVGYSQSFGGGDMDIYLLKINSSGDTLWTRTYGSWGNEEGKEIAMTSDGNFVIIGSRSNSGNNDCMFLKINPSGAVLWTKYYGGANYESTRSVKLAMDGGFIIAGKRGLSPTSPTSAWILKTNSLGDTTWTKSYNAGTSYEAKSIIANTDGTYTFCVDDSSAATDSDVRIMNISSTGTVNWSKSYGGTEKDITKMMFPTVDGGYVIGAISRSFGWSNPDMWLLKLNAVGDTLWTRHYGYWGHEHCHGLRQTSDGGYVLTGHSRSFSPNQEIMLVKVDPFGSLITIGPGELAWNDDDMNVYPNPSEGLIHVNLSSILFDGSVFRISNSLGQTVFLETIDASAGTDIKSIDLSENAPGLYFVSVQAKDQIITKRLVVN